MMETQTITQPLRICKVCGLEAYTEKDLELFVKHKQCKYNHDNFCKDCRNKYFSKWWKANLEERKAIEMCRNARKITIQGKQIRLKENPRTNICTQCGRNYPEDLKQQTSMHHEFHDFNNPLAGTIELCAACHASFHRKQEQGRN